MSARGKDTTAEVDSRISICRLCALVSGSKSFIPLYLNKEEQIITKEMNQLVPNVISHNDGLPQEACFKCVDNVSKCFKFINNVIRTQEKLRQMIQLSEAKLNDASPSPNQFLDSDDQWSAAADDDYGSRTPKDSVSKRPSRTGNETGSSSKKIASQPLPTKKTVDRVESSSSSSASQVDASATDTYMKRLSSCTFKPVSTDAGQESEDPSLKRIFRCGICYDKFTEKENCLAHIAEKHSGVQKPVQPYTIFEAIRKGAMGESAKNVESASTTSRTPSKGSSKGVTQATSKQLTNGETPVSRNELSSSHSQSQLQGAPKRLGTRHRKVLAIDSFYLEVDKRCTRYVCDDCGRMMMSRFAFVRHLHEHREPLKTAAAENEETAPPKRKAVSKSDCRYCNVCKKSVRDGLRHRMYHTIARLESQFPSSASMLANLS